MDALIVMDSDDLLGTENLNKGIMHPVDHGRWMEVYEKLDASKVVLQTGGSCANTIAAMGLMGAKVSYCGHLGSDEFGSTYAQQFVESFVASMPCCWVRGILGSVYLWSVKMPNVRC